MRWLLLRCNKVLFTAHGKVHSEYAIGLNDLTLGQGLFVGVKFGVHKALKARGQDASGVPCLTLKRNVYTYAGGVLWLLSMTS